MFYLIFKSFFKNQGLKLQSYKLMILVKNYSSSKILLYLKLSRQKQNKKMDLCRRYLNQIFVWAAKWLCMEKKKSKNKKLLWRWYLLSFNSGLFFFIFLFGFGGFGPTSLLLLLKQMNLDDWGKPGDYKKDENWVCACLLYITRSHSQLLEFLTQTNAWEFLYYNI